MSRTAAPAFASAGKSAATSAWEAETTSVPATSTETKKVVDFFHRCVVDGCEGESIEINNALLWPSIEKHYERPMILGVDDADILITMRFHKLIKGDAANKDFWKFDCALPQGDKQDVLLLIIRPQTSAISLDGPEETLKRRWVAINSVRGLFEAKWNQEW